MLGKNEKNENVRKFVRLGFGNFFCKGGSRMIKERKLRKNLSKVGIVKD